MKRLCLLGISLCVFFAAGLSAKEIPTYPSAAAKAHVGEFATVSGSVSGVHVTAKGDTFVNLGPAYPDNDFTAVIFADDAGKFDNLDGLDGKTVSVTGTIVAYHGKPEIVVKLPDHLKVK